MDRAYAYDPIGNRTVSRRGTDPNSLYQSNSLNQYLRIDLEGSDLLGQRFWHDPDGNLEEALAAGDADGDTDVDQDVVDLVLFYYDTPLPDPGDPNRPIYLRCDFSGNSYVDQDDVDILLFQFGQQYSSTLVAQFRWDGENRLVGWGPVTPQAGSKKLAFRYDYRNRRVEKRVSTYSGSAWAVSDVRRFIWSDWLPLAELKGDPNDPNEPNKYKVERYYTWGLDLAGLSGSVNSLQSAGGIGGLLACRDPNDPNDPNDLYGDFLYFFDANGNVGQLVDAAGSSTAAPVLAAKYEYDPYGNTLRAPADPNSGPYAAANPVRFSTKSWDDESALGYWGLRYGSAHIGLFLTRDPLDEFGGLNLYAYAFGNPTCLIDPLGLNPLQDLADYVLAICSRNPGGASVNYTLNIGVGSIPSLSGILSVFPSDTHRCCCAFSFEGAATWDWTGKIRKWLDVLKHNDWLRIRLKRYMPNIAVTLTGGIAGKVCHTINEGYCVDACNFPFQLVFEGGLKRFDGRSNQEQWWGVGPLKFRMALTGGGGGQVDFCRGEASYVLGGTAEVRVKWYDTEFFTWFFGAGGERESFSFGAWWQPCDPVCD